MGLRGNRVFVNDIFVPWLVSVDRSTLIINSRGHDGDRRTQLSETLESRVQMYVLLTCVMIYFVLT